MDFETCEISFDCVLPSAIFFNENLEPACIKCYALIRNLTKISGYCYATNKYLSRLMNSDESSVKRWISSLVKEGFLEIKTHKESITWLRHIYLSNKFNKCLRRLKNKLPPAQNRATTSSKSSYIKEEELKEDKLKEREEAPPPPPPSFYVHKRVLMESSKFDKLVEEFGMDKIKEVMERLDEYADINPKRFKQYACHAAVIRKWIREDAAKAPKADLKANKAASDASNEGSNRNWWGQMSKLLRPYEKEGIIYSGSSSVEFSVKGNPPEKVYFNDPNFVKIATNFLKKLEIMV